MWRIMDWNDDLTEEIVLAEFETRNEAIHFLATQRGSWIEESQ